MPIVEPSVSALINAALMGSTTDPNARNISTVVVMTRTVTISGSLENRLWIESCSSAGVPPTNTWMPCGGCSARRSAMFRAASPRSTRPFWITRTDGSFDPLSVAGRSFHIASGSLSGSVKPLTVSALARMSAICALVIGSPSSRFITRVICSVRNPGKSLSNCSWD